MAAWKSPLAAYRWAKYMRVAMKRKGPRARIQASRRNSFRSRACNKICIFEIAEAGLDVLVCPRIVGVVITVRGAIRVVIVLGRIQVHRVHYNAENLRIYLGKQISSATQRSLGGL